MKETWEIVADKLKEMAPIVYKDLNEGATQEQIDELERLTGIKDNKNIPWKTNPDIGIKNDWWNPLWIPFFDDADCNHYCIDLDPAKDGNYGQIIKTWHDDKERRMVARSFKDWFIQFKEDLLNGKLVKVEFSSEESLIYYGIDYKD
jgi:cell wall assembly regulator SMI1